MKKQRIKRVLRNTVVGGMSMVILLTLFGITAYAALLEPSIIDDTNPSTGSYFERLYEIGVGLAGVLAVLFIVIGGLEYIASAANPSAKESAKKRIWAAIGGLLLALASYLILQTINPALVGI